MSDPVRVLGIYAGHHHARRHRCLQENIGAFLGAARTLNTSVEFINLSDYELTIKDAEFSKEIPNLLKPVAEAVGRAELIAIASPVIWRRGSLKLNAFLEQVLAPLEEGGQDGGGYECWAKTGGLFWTCDDDGAAFASAQLLETLNQMAFALPPWATHYTNTEIPPGKTQDNWQRTPGVLAPIWVEHARVMRAYPHYSKLLPSK